MVKTTNEDYCTVPTEWIETGNKFYIGKDAKNSKSYFGSGTVLKQAINNEHKLEKLFNKLPAECKAEIEEKYQQKKKLENKKLKPIKLGFNSDFGNKENSKNENNITVLNITELLKIHNESFVKK